MVGFWEGSRVTFKPWRRLRLHLRPAAAASVVSGMKAHADALAWAKVPLPCLHRGRQAVEAELGVQERA